VTGYLAEKKWDSSLVLSASAIFIGHVILFLCGVMWLARFVPNNALLAMGVFPFIPGTVIKTALACWILPMIKKTVSHS
jgi:biotin transport system substrate-specific component